LLNSCLKAYTYGQDKACVPEETIEKALASLTQSKATIFSEIVCLDKMDRIGIPAYTCKINQEVAKVLKFEETYGKGITPEQAKASALMELVERYSGFMYLKNTNHFIIAPYKEIKEKAIPLDSLLHPIPFYYRDNKILEILESIPLAWVKAYSFKQDKEVLFPLPWFYRIYGTTGWAAGNTLEEAVLQSLEEIIERHCISLVIEGKKAVPTINISSINSPLVQELIEKIKNAGIEIFIKDFSLDLGIPTLAVITHDHHALISTIKVYATAGTHLNPEFAVIRGLNELAQHRAHMLYRELVQKRPGAPTYCFPRFKDLESAKFLLDGEKIEFASLPSFSHPDFKVEIEHLLDLLTQKHLEGFVIETTHPDLNLPAVIVVIPGARLNRPSAKLHPYLLIARQLMDIGYYSQAVVYLEQALDAEPSYLQIPQIVCQVAVCYKEAGQYSKAREYFQQALLLAPQLMNSPKFLADFAEIIQK